MRPKLTPTAVPAGSGSADGGQRSGRGQGQSTAGSRGERGPLS